MEEIKGKFDHTEADEDESQYNDLPNSRYHEDFDKLESQLNAISEDFQQCVEICSNCKYCLLFYLGYAKGLPLNIPIDI